MSRVFIKDFIEWFPEGEALLRYRFASPLESLPFCFSFFLWFNDDWFARVWQFGSHRVLGFVVSDLELCHPLIFLMVWGWCFGLLWCLLAPRAFILFGILSVLFFGVRLAQTLLRDWFCRC